MTKNEIFRKNFTLTERVNEYIKIKEKYNKIPIIICDLNIYSKELVKHKWLLEPKYKIHHLYIKLREYIKLQPYESVFLFLDGYNVIPHIDTQINDLYNRYKSEDGFLYLVFSKENTFG